MPAKAIPDAPLDPLKPISQRKFAALIGVLPQIVNQWVNEGWIAKDGTLRDWMRALGAQVKERRPTTKPKVSAAKLAEKQAQDPGSEDDGRLDLNQEKAALARTQRLIQEVKLAAARKEYAPIGLLTDVLASASAAVVAQFDQLEGRLAKSCPDLPEAAKLALHNTIGAARNTWITETAELIRTELEQHADPDEAEE